jgi:DNA-binding GntR family transcriptional regulator
VVIYEVVMLQDNYKTKAQIAYEYILKKIHEAAYVPGQKLIIEDVTKDLGISRIPVREAFKKLESEGILDITPNKSAIIKKIFAKDIEDIYEIRKVIESHAAISALNNLAKDDIRFLENNLRRMKISVSDKKMENYISLNKEFHFFIYEKTGNRWMVKCIESLWYFGRWVNIVTFFNEEIQKGYLMNHHEILLAIQRKDRDLVRTAFIEHIEQAKRNVVTHLLEKEVSGTDGET